MAIALDKDIREKAKADGKFMFQVSLDARFVPKDVKERIKGKVFLGKWEMCGPMSPEDAIKVWKLFRALAEANKI